MKLYQFLLPITGNNGVSYSDARALWEDQALARAGGFTRHGIAIGAWRDGATIYRDAMQNYSVACDEANALLLAADAMALFTDQKAIFFTHIGEATILERKAPRYEFSAEDRRFHGERVEARRLANSPWR